jgi:hypothetical protein
MAETKIPGCILKWNGTSLAVYFMGTHVSVQTRPMKRGGYYVSFYHDSYRHYATHVKLGEPFTAKRTRDYQYHGRRTGGAQQVRIDKVIKSTRNRHAKSLY